VDVDGNVVGLVLMLVATVSGLVLFSMFAAAARGRERAIEAGVIASHGGVGAVAIAVWFAFLTGSSEMGGARAFTVVLLALVLVAGLLMLRTVAVSRKDDPHGDTIPEATVNPLHIAGHVIVGSAAIIAVVVLAIRG
jgi:hypothetical protein